MTCATCPSFHEGNMHCGIAECGGPGIGRDFPSYTGPIPRESFSDRCLVCGSGKISCLITGLPTRFALCTTHKSVYNHVGGGGGGADGIKIPVTTIALP